MSQMNPKEGFHNIAYLHSRSLPLNMFRAAEMRRSLLKTFKIRYLLFIRQRFKGYCFESDMPLLFKYRVT